MNKTHHIQTRCTNILCAGLALLGAFCSALAFATEGERHISLQQGLAKAELIRLSVPAGDVEIVGITGNELIAEVTAVCEDEEREACLSLLKELGWAQKIGNTADFLLMPDGASHFNNVKIKVKIGVPQDKPLQVNLSAGELSIADTSACLTAELSAGQIDINLKESQLASAALSAKVGDVKLTTAKDGQVSGARSLLVGAHLEWQQGTGICHTKAKVLAGEVKLALK